MADDSAADRCLPMTNFAVSLQTWKYCMRTRLMSSKAQSSGDLSARLVRGDAPHARQLRYSSSLAPLDMKNVQIAHTAKGVAGSSHPGFCEVASK